MHVAVDKVSTSSISNRHHGECGDKEERQHAQRAVAHKLRPQVAHLHVLHILRIHHHALLGLCEAEEEQQHAYNGIDAHRGKPGTGSIGRVDDSLTVGILRCEGSHHEGNTRSHAQSAHIGQKHTHGGQGGNLVCIARER